MNNISIRKIYLYLFALIGLVISTIGAVQLVDLGLKSFIFQDADMQYAYPMEKPVAVTGSTTDMMVQPSKEEIEEYNEKQRRSQRQRESANALAMLIIGLPLYAYHWRVIKKEKDLI